MVFIPNSFAFANFVAKGDSDYYEELDDKSKPAYVIGTRDGEFTKRNSDVGTVAMNGQNLDNFFYLNILFFFIFPDYFSLKLPKYI